jgi:nucleoside-diphosphate-sugar epimerase
MAESGFIVDPRSSILVTGAGGFIGSRVAQSLRRLGFTEVRCLVRKPAQAAALQGLQVITGDLSSREDCRAATRGASLIYHLAAGFARSRDRVEADSVTSTRNLLEAVAESGSVRRFTLVSSFSVYDTRDLAAGAVLDESCPVEREPEGALDAYSYGKLKQEQLLRDRRAGMEYTIVRPGSVFGPGKAEISGRIGIARSGLFLHLGGSNLLPLTYVDNCADAIVLAGIVKGIDGEVFNVVDDDLITSTEFLRSYKASVAPLRSVYVPRVASRLMCAFGDLLSRKGGGEAFPLNSRRWSHDWKSSRYSNEKAKRLLGWSPAVPLRDGLQRYYQYCRTESQR